MNKLLYILLFFLFISACGTDKSRKTPVSKVPVDDNFITTPRVNDNLAVPDNTLASEYRVLLIGNSHVMSNNLASIIETFIKVGKPENPSDVVLSNGFGFLDEKLNDGITLKEIQSETWSHVVLQAQKYSQSGNYTYPTIAAEYWIDNVKQNNATPILFPEHPQANHLDEAQYIHDLHLSIQEKQLTCIAPIGLGWNKVVELLPDLVMHSPDGNHAAYTGSVFTALIFYQVITGELADALPYISEIDLSETIQGQLGEIASQILEEHPACDY